MKTRSRSLLAASITGLALGIACLLVPRSPHWSKVRADYLRLHPACEACGAAGDIQVHHVKPFHLVPELELDPTNLIGLCGPHGCNAHFRLGHLGNYELANPNVRRDAAEEWRQRKAGKFP